MRLFKYLTLLLLLLLTGFMVAPFFLVYLGIEDRPRVAPLVSAGHNDVARLRTLLKEHDPRDLPNGETRTVRVLQRDLNLGLNAANPWSDSQSARLAFTPGLGVAHYSLRLPPNPLGTYFNVSLLISEADGALELASVQLGETTVSGFWLSPFLLLADRQLQQRVIEYRGAREALHAVHLESGAATFVYQWNEELLSQIEARGREMLLPAADRERIAAYYGELVTISAGARRRESLALLLQPMFALSSRRSADGDSAGENRALLLALGTALKGASVAWLIGDETSDDLGTPRAISWTLLGRSDLAQHFAISAAIAAAGGGALADAIGVYKELDDSRAGTGFSFADLLADRAGVVLAEHAGGDGAHLVQSVMSRSGLRESDFMPAIDHLPEGLMELPFNYRYGDLDDRRYAAVKREIDLRIDSLRLYSQF